MGLNRILMFHTIFSNSTKNYSLNTSIQIYPFLNSTQTKTLPISPNYHASDQVYSFNFAMIGGTREIDNVGIFHFT